MFLEISQNSWENACARYYFLIKLKVFSWEFCKIFKNTFFYRRLPVAASEYLNFIQAIQQNQLTLCFMRSSGKNTWLGLFFVDFLSFVKQCSMGAYIQYIEMSISIWCFKYHPYRQNQPPPEKVVCKKRCS